MKTSIKVLAALCMMTAAGSAFAAGSDSYPAEETMSGAPSAALAGDNMDVPSGLSLRDGDDANVGARGQSGSRFSMRTREEVQAELAADRMTNDPNAFVKSIYFGD